MHLHKYVNNINTLLLHLLGMTVPCCSFDLPESYYYFNTGIEVMLPMSYFMSNHAHAHKVSVFSHDGRGPTLSITNLTHVRQTCNRRGFLILRKKIVISSYKYPKFKFQSDIYFLIIRGLSTCHSFFFMQNLPSIFLEFFTSVYLQLIHDIWLYLIWPAPATIYTR